MTTATPKTPKAKADTLPAPASPTVHTLAAALAAHHRLSAEMDDIQALIAMESERLEAASAKTSQARQARHAIYERLLNSQRQGTPDDPNYRGEWDSMKQHQEHIRAHPDFLQAADAEALAESAQAEIEARKRGLIEAWHRKLNERDELRRSCGPVDELGEMQAQRRALEEELEAIAAMIADKEEAVNQPPPPDDSQERRAVLLANVAMGEPGAAEELAALDKTIAARAAAKIAADQARAETRQLLQGLEAKRAAKQASIERIRQDERAALLWHLENEREAEHERWQTLQSELHTSNLRLAALANIIGSDREHPVPPLRLPDFTENDDNRLSARATTRADLTARGLDLSRL